VMPCTGQTRTARHRYSGNRAVFSRRRRGRGGCDEEHQIMTSKEAAAALLAVMPGFAVPQSVQSVGAAIEDTLSQILPESEVRAGAEINRLRHEGGQWKGAVEFLLLLSCGVIHVKGTLTEGPARTLNLTHQILPLSSVRRVVVTTKHDDKM